MARTLQFSREEFALQSDAICLTVSRDGPVQFVSMLLLIYLKISPNYENEIGNLAFLVGLEIGRL